jgi:hypothetical protein
MNPLVEKLRKARESSLEVGGFDFTIRRPTDVEVVQMDKSPGGAGAIPFVIGWGKVREIDVLPSGDGRLLAFDAEVCREWLSDRPDLLGPLLEAITKAYIAHREAIKELEKN